MTEADRALYAQFQQLKKELTAEMMESQERYQLLIHRVEALERACFAGRGGSQSPRQSSAAYPRPPAENGLAASPFAGPSPTPRYGVVMKRPMAMASDRIRPFQPTVLSTANLSAATSAPAPLRATAEALARAVPEGAEQYTSEEVAVPPPAKARAAVRSPSFPTVTRDSVIRRSTGAAGQSAGGKAPAGGEAARPAPRHVRWPSALTKRPALPAEEERPAVSNVSSGMIIPFIKEYNGLFRAGMSTAERRAARDEFIRKYRLRGLRCANAEERVRNPDRPAHFTEVEKPASGDLWALPLSAGQYAVVPNHGLRYEARRHNADGLKEIYDSNFQGGTYARIRVLAPAFFHYRDNQWTPGGRGSLQLG